VDEIKEVIRLLKQERDQLKTEVEREIWERKEKEKWHDMARELFQRVNCIRTAEKESEDVVALARFNAMEGKV